MTRHLPTFTDAQVLHARGAKNVVDPRRPYAFLVEPEYQPNGRVESVATLFLTNRECPFRCLFCDLWQNTTDDRVKVEVARALANHGNRKSLDLLVSLLGSQSLAVRVQSAKVLRQFTGQAFEFTPYETAKIRAAAIGRWKTWVEQKSELVSLRFPLTNFNRDHGRILICDYSRHRLVEMDLTGKIVWETKVGRNPWGVQGLENGHRLVASYSRSEDVV